MATLRKNIFDFNKNLIGYQLYDTETRQTTVHPSADIPIIRTDIPTKDAPTKRRSWSPKMSIIEAARYIVSSKGHTLQ